MIFNMPVEYCLKSRTPFGGLSALFFLNFAARLCNSATLIPMYNHATQYRSTLWESCHLKCNYQGTYHSPKTYLMKSALACEYASRSSANCAAKFFLRFAYSAMRVTFPFSLSRNSSCCSHLGSPLSMRCK